MGRPVKYRAVCRMPRCQRFYGSDRGENAILITVDEYETLRLIDYAGMSQAECAVQMHISRGTVQALYAAARRKAARFLVEGTSLKIEGGNYEICTDSRNSCPDRIFGSDSCKRKGENKMKIAVTYEDGQVFQHFGHTEKFKIYDVEAGRVVAAAIVDTDGQGHGALGGFLAEQGVDVLICGGIGGGARNALAAAGIQLYGGACGDADAQVTSFLSGSLNYNPNAECSHHGEGHHGEDHECGQHGCH